MAVATAMREPVLGRPEQARFLRIAGIDDRLDESARGAAFCSRCGRLLHDPAGPGS